MPRLLDADLFRRRYFERGGPSDDALRKDIEAGNLRGAIVCGQVYVADDALYNNEPWQPEKPSKNPLLAAV